MKKLLLILMCMTLVGISACSESETDATRFKKEYEALNGNKSASGKTIRSLDIPKENPMIYTSAANAVKKIKSNKGTYVFYFGFAECPWCRSMVNNLISVAKNLKIDKVYYVDVENIRDVKEVDKSGKVVEKSKGSKAYYELLSLLGPVLADYSLTDADGNPVKVNEKRIYAPNVVVVNNGKALDLQDGCSDLESDPYAKITTEMNKQSKTELKKILKLATDTCGEVNTGC